jgi:hypothetical protein
MEKVIAFCMMVAFCVSCSSSDDQEVDRASCERVRDHLIDLRLITVQGSPKIDLAQHRAAFKQAMGESFLSGCQATMTASQVRCALDANDATTASACSKPQRTASK